MGQPERKGEEGLRIPPFEDIVGLTNRQIDELIEKLMHSLKDKRKSQILCLFYTEQNPDIMMEQRDVSSVYNLLRQNGSCETLEIFLHSDGGDIHTAFEIAKLCRKYCKQFNVIIPEYAMSAATLLCLGANEILLSKIGHLGPLDPIVKVPRLGWIPCTAIRMAPKILEGELGTEKGVDPRLKAAFIIHPIAAQIDPYLLTAFANMPSLGVEYGLELLRLSGKPEEEAKRCITKLVYGYPAHGYVIDIDEILQLGLNVKELEPDEESIVCDILQCYKAIDNKRRLEGEILSQPIIRMF